MQDAANAVLHCGDKLLRTPTARLLTLGSTWLGCAQHSMASSAQPMHSTCMPSCPANSPGLDLVSTMHHRKMDIRAPALARPRAAMGTQPTVMMPQ
jgi:hypothetical protein